MYFSNSVNPFLIETIFLKSREIFKSGTELGYIFLLFPFIVLTPYLSLVFFYKKNHYHQKQFNFSIIFIIILFSYFPKRVLRKRTDINNIIPRKDSATIYNSLKVFSASFFKRLPKIYKKEIKNTKEYLDYKIIEKNNTLEKMNIAIIFEKVAFITFEKDKNNNGIIYK